MNSQIATGFSDSPNSLEAGIRAAQSLVDCLGSKLELLLFFTTDKHQVEDVYQGITQVLPSSVSVVGGASLGIITAEEVEYGGYQVGVLGFAPRDFSVQCFHEQGLDRSELVVGESLGRQLALSEGQAQGILLFYDAINRTSGKLKFNQATPLLKGMQDLFSDSPPLAGAGMFGSMRCQSTWQYFNHVPYQQSAFALLFKGNIRMHTKILHGCRPASDYFTITKAEANVIYEIDHKPAMDIIGEILGAEEDAEWKENPFFVIFGINHGEKYDDFKEEDYAIRLCLKINHKEASILMYESDLQVGTEVQLMRRTIPFSDVEHKTKEFLESIKEDGQSPLFAFYTDCAGRAGDYCGSDEEEAYGVQAALEKEIPLFGIYAAVEISTFKNTPSPLAWTGVLSVFSQKT